MPSNISTDRGQTVVAPESLTPGTVVKIYGSLPYAYRRALTALGLQVTTTDGDGLLGTSYENVIGAVVYDDKKVTFTTLSRAVARGWQLVPKSNITPADPTFL